MSTRHRSLRLQRSRGKRSRPPILEGLEARLVLSVRPHLNFMEFHDPSRIPAGETPSPMGILPLVGGLPFPIGYEPGDIQTAYGIDKIKFGSVTGDGTGQTIAIVDAYDDPSFREQHGLRNSPTATSPSSMLSSAFPIHPASPRSTSRGKTSPLPGHRPRRRWQRQRQLGDRGGPRYRMGPWHRPGGQHRSRRGDDRQQRRPVHRGRDGRRSSRRLGGLDELGPQRIQRRNIAGQHVRNARPDTGRHVRGGFGRFRRFSLRRQRPADHHARHSLSGRLAQRRRGRRHDPQPQCRQHL